MEIISACDIPSDLGHHVYVLFSRTRPDIVKVGRSKNRARIIELQKMNYADVADWHPYQIEGLETAQAAVAVEAMAHARLTNEGVRLARIRWTRLPDQKACFADECFRCSVLHAAAVVKEMLAIYKRSVAYGR